ncbi:NAD(P)/FAD-dependent oxidoreductase [Promethearchaeum syntrophicum]|uniref:NAD(P)/FAD-dependent oxidoreductase n=1 Tax=Promethearchaeum syntrophicum TaxID=2594042 RepID=A0A5B9D8H2_9ARCH|nr:NAD(P)/FAD-dependent oxidoreductase [Candidatus Prometheoarchaeum syntrophicum]QEE15382.1 Digeranylgeranylglycerophospholipid reductase [Candidatus Prometheoarchaeum syntrophicum]
MEKFDIIVVGAGPGGSIAAKIAADKGYSICLLEKEDLGKNGRYKACGGAMAWELIDKIKFPEEKIDRMVEKLILHHVDGNIYSKKGKGAVIWRNKFDKFLTDMAITSGAELKQNEGLLEIKKINSRYLIRTSNSKYSAKYIIAADGVNSPTLSKLYWEKFDKKDLILTLTQEMELNKKKIDERLGNDEIHLFFGIKDFIPLGYAWLFPKKDALTVGWGNQIGKIKHTKSEFNKFLNIPLVNHTIKDANLIRYTPHLIPVGVRPILYKDFVFAVGDAGGMVDPISGKGIPYAMMSAEIAIKTINYCEKRDREEKMGETYIKRLDRSFLSILKQKRNLREKIFQNDERLKSFLELWENHRSSEIILRNLL